MEVFTMKTRKVGVIGLGHVGAHVAYSLAVQGIADELVLVDQNEAKVNSERQDLADSAAYLPHRVNVKVGDFADLGDCDVLVNCVGKIDLLRGNHNRVTEMDFTIPAVNGYVDKIKASGFSGVLVNITNPCDIVTRQLAMGLGLPRGRVFGTGTGLDTSRLLSALSRQTEVDHKSITAYMLGEHGASQFAPWSCVSFRGKPLEDWAKTNEKFRFDHEALQKEAIGGGWVTFSGKYCTEYGISTTAARMVSIVLHDEKQIMPASMELQGEYGESGLFVGVPCVIGANGVEEVVELPLTAEEQAQFHTCCEDVRHNMEHLKDLC
jgi:L-lactate dehydrogenase